MFSEIYRVFEFVAEPSKFYVGRRLLQRLFDPRQRLGRVRLVHANHVACAPVGRQRSNMRGAAKPAKMLTSGTPAAAATCWPAES